MPGRSSRDDDVVRARTATFMTAFRGGELGLKEFMGKLDTHGAGSFVDQRPWVYDLSLSPPYVLLNKSKGQPTVVPMEQVLEQYNISSIQVMAVNRTASDILVGLQCDGTDCTARSSESLPAPRLAPRGRDEEAVFMNLLRPSKPLTLNSTALVQENGREANPVADKLFERGYLLGLEDHCLGRDPVVGLSRLVARITQRDDNTYKVSNTLLQRIAKNTRDIDGVTFIESERADVEMDRNTVMLIKVKEAEVVHIGANVLTRIMHEYIKAVVPSATSQPETSRQFALRLWNVSMLFSEGDVSADVTMTLARKAGTHKKQSEKESGDDDKADLMTFFEAMDTPQSIADVIMGLIGDPQHFGQYCL